MNVAHCSVPRRRLPSRARRGGCFIAAEALAGVLLACGAARGQDVVHLAPAKDGRGATRLAGEVVDHTRDRLELRVGERVHELDAARVLRVETRCGAAHEQADTLFAARDFKAALELYQQAHREETRDWVRRGVAARVVVCLANTDAVDRAGELFLALVGSDAPAPHFAALPLAWTAGAPGPAIERQARVWLARSDAVGSLLGASWSLSGAARGEAEATLERLTRDADARVARLAAAQLWRARVVTVEPVEISKWQSQLERLPAGMDAGPSFVVAQALARFQRHEQAALAALRGPVLYPHDGRLNAEALYLAARELENASQLSEAQNLYRELIERHGASSRAAEAQSRLAALEAAEK